MIHTQTTSLYDDINFAILCSQKINNDGDYSYWDYAIRTDISTLNNSPYTLLWGERKLLYSYLFEFNNGKDPNIKKLATAFYMYCIIKINIRKNYILTNKFVGLENFQDHNNKHCDVGDNIKDKYVIQSSLEGNSKIKIEPRFSINLYKEYTSLKSRELEELPRFVVMIWQPFMLLRSASLCLFRITLCMQRYDFVSYKTKVS